MGFFAYSSEPAEIGRTVEHAVEILRSRAKIDVYGNPARHANCRSIPCRQDPGSSEARLFSRRHYGTQFQRLHEIGFAIGRRKPLL